MSLTYNRNVKSAPLTNLQSVTNVPSRKVKSAPLPSLQSVKSVTSLQSVKSVKNNFVFFGCWNNINCEDKNILNVRDTVLSLLKKLKENTKIILAGDNWYSQKRDNKKYYLPEILISGYKKLFDVSKDVSIVLGNHDINKPKNRTLCEDLGCMLFLQVKAIENILSNSTDSTDSTDNLNVTEMQLKPLYRFKKVKLYSCEPRLVKQYNSNVYFLYLNTNIFLEDAEYIYNYIEKIEKLLTLKYISLLYIIGHHPFFSYKPKDTDTDSSKYFKSVKELYFKKPAEDKIAAIYSILDIFARYKSIYLCADVHNFQICKLHRNIVMITCGTGGADRDEVNEPITSSSFPLNKSYTATDLYVHNSYGFSDITYDDNSIFVDYYKIADGEAYNKKKNLINYSIYSYNISLENLKITKLESQENLNIKPLSASLFSSIKGSRNRKFCDKSQDLNTFLATYDGISCGIKEK